jgi:hypothetical protein
MFDIAVFDMAEPSPLLEEGLALFPPGAAEVLLLSFDDGDAVEEVEPAGAAGLLQPIKAKDRQRARARAVKRIRMISSMDGMVYQKAGSQAMTAKRCSSDCT